MAPVLPDGPMISIIMATWNAGATIDECLGSLAGQTFRGFELLVQDAQSSDDTLAVVARYPSLKADVVSESDGGIYDAWNRALARARGEWVYFIGADNRLWAPDTLGQIAEQLTVQPQDVAVMYGQIVRVTESGEVIDLRGRPWAAVHESFLRYLSSVPHAACFQRRQSILRLGGFDARFKIRGDSQILLKTFLKSKPVFVDIPVVAHRMGGVSTTPAKQAAGIAETVAILREADLPVFPAQTKYMLARMLSALAAAAGNEWVNCVSEFARRFTAGRASGKTAAVKARSGAGR